MRVGLLTYHFSENYGALFQAYALRKWLLMRGLDAEFINYHPAYVEEGGALEQLWKPSLWRKNATIAYMKLSHMQRRFFGNTEQRKGFEAFRAQVLGVNGPRLRTMGEVQSEVAKYDVLIAGSDQIWNPSIQRGLDPVYFLNISNTKHARKIAYAPSFGRGSIDPKFSHELNQLVSGLHGVSVREESGLDVLEASGLHRAMASVVPDPTILLGQFDEMLEGHVRSEDHVFCYALRTDEIIRDVAQITAKKTKHALISPRSSRQRWKDIGSGVIPGPAEWLRMLASAKLVVSNSFHGIALSVVLNKPFIAVSLPGKRAEMNARAENLLRTLNLTNRIVANSNPKTLERLIDEPINWEIVNERVILMRRKGGSYLEAQLSSQKESFEPKS